MTVSTLQITDYSNEKSTFQVNSVVLNAGNFAAQSTAAAALVGAVEDLSIGEVTKQTLNQIVLDAPAVPTNVYAQRELKWLVTYQGDTSGKLFSLEIACPDITDNIVPATDLADLASTDWAAFVTAFEAFARSPDDLTETVTVASARLVGRNI